MTDRPDTEVGRRRADLEAFVAEHYPEFRVVSGSLDYPGIDARLDSRYRDGHRRGWEDAMAEARADDRLREAAVAVCQLWFTDNAPEGSRHVRKAMLDLRAALASTESDARPTRFDRTWSHYADDCPVPPTARADDRLREALEYATAFMADPEGLAHRREAWLAIARAALSDTQQESEACTFDDPDDRGYSDTYWKAAHD